MRLRFSTLMLVLVATVATASFAQSPVPTAGTHFSFGIVEGPDASVPGGQLQSELYLTVLSQYSGCGLLVSPSGFSRQFSFDAGVPVRVPIDYAMMQLFEQGKSNKGLLLTTSQPVNAFFHDWTKDGGDATQIFPDEALDTSYVVGGWGLWNDPGEQNHACVMVVAAEDNTVVTVTPSVRTLAGQPAKRPITVTLNRGETYSVKADITSQPSSTSLSGTVVSSSQPVAVFSGVTCAYVPIGVESCNEMLDQVLGKKWWSKHYFAQPLGNGDSTVRLILTSDRDFFASMNGAPVFSSNGRIQTSFDKPVEISASLPVQVQQIVGGSLVSGVGVGDPSLVTLLSADHYDDTLYWSIPNLGMANFAPIIVPTADLGQTLIDGQPLSTQGAATVINGSAYSALRLNVYPGVHRLESPNGVFTLGVGFDIFDAFTYVAGSVGPELPRDTVTRRLVVQIDSAATCDTFSVQFSFDSAIIAKDGVTDLSPTILFDPNLMSLVSFTPGPMLSTTTYYVDSTIPGVLRIQIIGRPLVTGNNLFKIVFFGKASGDASFNTSLNVGACGEVQKLFIAGATAFAIRASEFTMPRTFSIVDSAEPTLTTCLPYELRVVADSVIVAGNRFVPVKIEFTYDTPADDLQSAQLAPALSARLLSEQNVPGRYTARLTSGPAISGIQDLARFVLTSNVAGRHSGTVTVSYLLCSDTVSKSFQIEYVVGPNIDSTHAQLALSISPVTWGNESSADVQLSGLPIDAHVKDFTLDIRYDHDVLTFFRTESAGTLTSGWQASAPSRIDNLTDRFSFSSAGSELGTSGPLVHLLFRTYVSDSASTTMGLTSSLSGSTQTGSVPCPVLYRTPVSSLIYAGRDLCGDSLLRRYLNSEPIEITGVQSDANAIRVQLESRLSSAATVSLVDLLGNIVATRELDVKPGRSVVEFMERVPSGVYIARLTASNVIRSRRVSVAR